MSQDTTEAAILTKPVSIKIIAPGVPAFAEACVHIREGYVFHPAQPVEILPNGHAMFTLVMGCPSQAAINAAKESSDHALRLQKAQYELDVKQAAEAIVAQQKRDELEKQVAAEVAAHQRKIKELEKSAAAAIAKL